MLMRRLKAVTIDVKACIEGGHYYDFATSPYWKKHSPHWEEIRTARELLHLAKARGWGAERLEAEEKLAESIERSKEWRREGLKRFLGS